ncbi:uncharacterized protein BO97DRAFT_353890 [Aspergillus homomorphus CBS 101889]|uniref:Protein kinase domain-containing protein n=1 Tax=Aspergillus homomorphus (strain CBS 101889) TaxID=1450537 RepID=A0A395HKQ5_ASPHC|nr:hypothetical protein BO97DRAFT_353890 [Aspergillus homomorphus CBS 101889]RAL08531.1 hypothetical protein BO97DRAFT_353890 [Aspergillus homomorphus CBS 101889]
MIVAKLYDPHYGGASGTTAAVFHAEVQYMRESAAYRHAAVHHVQHLAPHYYGSWSTCIESEEWPVPSRDVRLILTGYVNGKDMTCLSPRQFSQMERKAIMRQILTAESRFYACDLCHNDLFPRNVLITAPSARLGSSGPPRIVIIDFGLATIGRSSADVYSADDPYLLSERYISPILRWWRSLGETNIWGRWVDWDWNQWLTETFAADKPDITPEMLKWLHPHERNHSFFLEVLERNRVCSW